MTPEQIEALSAFLNNQANLPVNIQAIADELKALLVSPEVTPEITPKGDVVN